MPSLTAHIARTFYTFYTFTHTHTHRAHDTKMSNRRGCCSAFIFDLLDNPQIPACEPDPDSLHSARNPFSPDFAGVAPPPPPPPPAPASSTNDDNGGGGGGGGGGGSNDDDAGNVLDPSAGLVPVVDAVLGASGDGDGDGAAGDYVYVMVPDDEGVSCAQACEHQGHANSTWCQQKKSPVHPYNRYYCICGLAEMTDPVRFVNSTNGSKSISDWTVPTNYEYACAYNQCDTDCLNKIGFYYAIAAGLGLCLFFFVVGEVYSHYVGTAGRMVSVYGLYYLLLFALSKIYTLEAVLLSSRTHALMLIYTS